MPSSPLTQTLGTARQHRVNLDYKRGIHNTQGNTRQTNDDGKRKIRKKKRRKMDVIRSLYYNCPGGAIYRFFFFNNKKLENKNRLHDGKRNSAPSSVHHSDLITHFYAAALCVLQHIADLLLPPVSRDNLSL